MSNTKAFFVRIRKKTKEGERIPPPPKKSSFHSFYDDESVVDFLESSLQDGELPDEFPLFIVNSSLPDVEIFSRHLFDTILLKFKERTGISRKNIITGSYLM